VPNKQTTNNKTNKNDINAHRTVEEQLLTLSSATVCANGLVDLAGNLPTEFDHLDAAVPSTYHASHHSLWCCPRIMHAYHHLSAVQSPSCAPPTAPHVISQVISAPRVDKANDTDIYYCHRTLLSLLLPYSLLFYRPFKLISSFPSPLLGIARA
jgi:hypothetical protein